MKLMLGITGLFFLIFALLSTCATFIEEKVCEGDVYVNSSNIHSFKNCTRIDGFLYITDETFNGGDEMRKMDPSELEVFSTLREVKGLEILEASHPNFTDLHCFRNLETINGLYATNLSNALGGLRIYATSLKSLGLRALTTISFYVHIEDNMNLCFADDINWVKLMTRNVIAHLNNNKPKSECVAEEMVCDKACSKDGCWGPSIDDCLSCVIISPDNKTCLDSCSYPGLYQFTNKCLRCSPDCKRCWGPRKDQCEDKDINVPAIVGGVLACTLLLCLFVALVFYQWRQRAKARDNTVMTMILNGLEDDEPLQPSDVKPNLVQLRVVKETELRKGGILGCGAFGTVYKAVWVPEGESIKIPVAIKILRSETGTNANTEILEEAYLMASIAHPHLLKLLAVCMTSQMMLVTQLMPLGCLLDYVRSNKEMIGSKPLLNWSTQIAKGMTYLEEKRLVHRDLAARNVLVQTPRYVKITDFGLAKLLNMDESAYQATGGKVAIKWLAPECIHHRRYTHRSDVWAFGVTVWELMTYGCWPYENIPIRDVLEFLEKGERLTQPGMCTIEVYMLMLKCWLLDAESRPSFQELAEDFAKMARDPGRYLVIEGDSLMRLPTYTPKDEQELISRMSITTDGTEGIVYAEDYLRLMSPDDNETQDKSSHSYLEVVGDPACIAEVGKNGKKVPDFSPVRIGESVDGEGYLVAAPPEYDYAYDDLEGSSQQVEDTKLSKEDLEPVVMTDYPENVTMPIGGAEQTMHSPQKNHSSNDDLVQERIQNDLVPCVP